MPILLHVDELEPGMCLAGNIMNQFSVLLSNGHHLTDKDILSLKRLMPNEFVRIGDPILEQIIDFEDDHHDKMVSLEVRKNVASVVKNVSEQISAGVTLDADNIAGIQNVIEQMLDYLQENPVTMALIEQSAGWDSYLQQHCANVFYLSLVIGNTIRNYIRTERQRLTVATYIHNSMNLTPLATASIFHDIGMVPIEYIYHKDEPLTDDEMLLIREHPRTGADVLPEQIDPMVRQIILNHHENHQGTGYPDGISGDKINIFARIIRIADAYSAAVADKIYCKGKSSALVLYEMIHGAYCRFYDPVVLKVFSNIVPPFPIGAKLTLQNKKCAVVVRHNHTDPFKPHVVIAFDELGDPISHDLIEKPFLLGERKECKLHSFAGRDISFLNNHIFSEHNNQAQPTHKSNTAELLSFMLP